MKAETERPDEHGEERPDSSAFFAAMNSSERQDLLALAADDIEWIIPGEGWPLAGTHRGHMQLAAVLQKASDEVEMAYPKPPEFVAQTHIPLPQDV